MESVLQNILFWRVKVPVLRPETGTFRKQNRLFCKK